MENSGIARLRVGSGCLGHRLASLEARALAIVGDRAGAVAALADTERSREAVPGYDEVRGIFAFPVAKQFAYAGTTQLAVGGREHIQQAIASADTTAIRLYRSAEDDDQSGGDLFAAHVDLARGHLLLSDLDGTEAMLEGVLESPPERMSASIVRRLTALGRELSGPQYGGAAQAAPTRTTPAHGRPRGVAELSAAHDAAATDRSRLQQRPGPGRPPVALPVVGRVVDVGCGNGKFIQRLREDRPDLALLGLDIAPGILAGVPGPVAVADTTRLPLATASVDATLALQCPASWFVMGW